MPVPDPISENDVLDTTGLTLRHLRQYESAFCMADCEAYAPTDLLLGSNYDDLQEQRDPAAEQPETVAATKSNPGF